MTAMIVLPESAKLRSADTRAVLLVESSPVENNVSMDVINNQRCVMQQTKIYRIPEVGSSRNITDGLETSSHAIANRRRSPPEIPRTFSSPT
jgi:hypothetical protein